MFVLSDNWIWIGNSEFFLLRREYSSSAVKLLKSGVSSKLKSLFLLKSKKIRVLYSKQDKTLPLLKRQFGPCLVSICIEHCYSYIVLKKE